MINDNNYNEINQIMINDNNFNEIFKKVFE